MSICLAVHDVARVEWVIPCANAGERGQMRGRDSLAMVFRRTFPELRTTQDLLTRGAEGAQKGAVVGGKGVFWLTSASFQGNRGDRVVPEPWAADGGPGSAMRCVPRP